MTDEWSSAEPRPLSFPLQYSEIIRGETPLDAIQSGVFLFPEDPDERTIVLFELSQREYTALASAVDVGRDIAYGEDSLKLWWLWIRNMVQVPSFCERMIDCITNDADTLQAIVDALGTSESFVDMISERVLKLPSGQVSSPLVGGDCDLNVVAGRAIAVVDTLDANNVDFLEIVEVGTNDEERVSAVISAIPGLSEAPVDEIIDILQSLLEDFVENYAAAVTLGWKNEVSEAIYCIMRESDDCSLTYQQLFEYFRDRAGANLTLGSLIRNVIEYVINGDFGTDELIASGMYAIQLGFILTGQSFNGLVLPAIGAIMRDASPSSAWEDWDDCPPEPETCDGAKLSHDFRVSESGFSITHPEFGYAKYNSGSGWSTNPALGNTFTISIERAIGDPVNVARIYINQEQLLYTYYVRTTVSNGWSTVATPARTGTEGSLFWLEWDLPELTTGIAYQILSGAIPDAFRLVRACEWWDE